MDAHFIDSLVWRKARRDHVNIVNNVKREERSAGHREGELHARHKHGHDSTQDKHPEGGTQSSTQVGKVLQKKGCFG